MALLEDLNCCCVCDDHVFGRAGGFPRYYCDTCYSTHYDAIKNKEEWIMRLFRDEQSRRVKRNLLIKKEIFPTRISFDSAKLVIDQWGSLTSEGRTVLV